VFHFTTLEEGSNLSLAALSRGDSEGGFDRRWMGWRGRAPLGEPLSSLLNLANYLAITLKRQPQ